MKRNSIKLFISLILILLGSCNDPETVVTNFVHTNGSVTRKIEMKSHEGDINKRFKISEIQVPLDGSWIIRDSCEVDKKGDTTWVRRAEKIFKNVGEINLAYKSDSGSNKGFSRYAGFTRKFRWFNTEFRYFERIDKKLTFGYPVKNFLNSEELRYFYSPQKLKDEKENGPDSLKFKALSDSVKHKTDIWTEKNLVSEWIGEFSKLTEGKTRNDITFQSLKSRENKFVKIIEKNDKQLDSLWKTGKLLKEFLGEENALKYKSEADSALSIVTANLFANFNDFSMRIAMPGKLIETNGFIDSSHILQWPIKADYFMTEPYDMWAQSKMPNTWAWIISGLFVMFVLSGVLIKIIKKD
jgi:hypothetical protein